MLLVTGATGSFGKAAIDFLIKKNIPVAEIAALARNEEKAKELIERGIEVRLGDYDNYASLIKAFKGIDKLLFVAGSDIFDRGKQHVSIINAAKESGVKHIFYTSFERNHESESSPIAIIAKSHIDTDQNIKKSGLTYTILRNGLYVDMLPMFMGEKVLETGVFLPAGEGKASFTSRVDLAEAAVNILIGNGHENKEYVLTNVDNYSFDDVAKILSEISGKKVQYTSPSKEVYKETVLNAGVPAEYADIITDFCESIKQGEFYTTKTDIQNILGRKPMSLGEYLKSVYSS